MTQSFDSRFPYCNKHLLFSEKLTHYMTHAHSLKKPRNIIISIIIISSGIAAYFAG